MIKWIVVDKRAIDLATRRAGLDVEIGECLLDAKRERIWQRLGMGSFDEWAQLRFGYDGRELRERVRVARKCEQMPCFKQALAKGDVCWSAVREATRIAQPNNADEWLADARALTVRQLEAKVATLRPGDGPNAKGDPSRRKHVVRLEMNGEKYAKTTGIIDLVKLNLGDVTIPDGDAVLVALQFWAEQHGSAKPRSPYQIAIQDRDGSSFVTARGEEIEISHASREKAECDAQIVSANVPVRACRKMPPKKKRFVRVRAKGKCEVPGCRNRFGLEDHHIILWSEGGDHDTDYVCVLCSAHHDRIHDGTLVIEGDQKTGLRFFHADGTPYGKSLDPTRSQAFVDAFEALRTMGMKHGETQRVLAELRALDPDMKAEEIIRLAMKKLAHVGHGVVEDAVSALKNLGYKVADVKAIVERVARGQTRVEEVIRLALREIGKPRVYVMKEPETKYETAHVGHHHHHVIRWA